MNPKSKLIYEGRIISVSIDTVTLPDKREMSLEVVRHKPAAAVVPIRDDGHILLVKQYRPVVQNWFWEIPAGLMDEGETPLQAAHRELEEETGWRAEKLEFLTSTYTTFGFSDEVLHIFRGTDLKQTKKNFDTYEIMEEHFLSPQEIRRMISAREIVDAKTLVGLLYSIDPIVNKTK